jgi:hypothetical protein
MPVPCRSDYTGERRHRAISRISGAPMISMFCAEGCRPGDPAITDDLVGDQGTHRPRTGSVVLRLPPRPI